MITLELTEEEAKYVSEALMTEAYSDWEEINFPSVVKHGLSRDNRNYKSLVILRDLIHKLGNNERQLKQPFLSSPLPEVDQPRCSCGK